MLHSIPIALIDVVEKSEKGLKLKDTATKKQRAEATFKKTIKEDHTNWPPRIDDN